MRPAQRQRDLTMGELDADWSDIISGPIASFVCVCVSDARVRVYT